VVELLGAVVAGGFYRVVVPGNIAPGISGKSLLVPGFGPLSTNLAAIFMELIVTFILVLVVFRVVAGVRAPVYTENMTKEQFIAVTAKKDLFWHKKMLAVPFAIGAALGFLGFPSGYVSGGFYNPAIVFGGCLWGNNWSKIWVYWLGEFAGGALAGVFDFIVFEHHPRHEDADVSQFYANEEEHTA